MKMCAPAAYSFKRFNFYRDNVTETALSSGSL